MDIFILGEEDFRFDLTRDDIPSWDSLGTVALAVGLHEGFGYHCTAEEAMSIKSVPDIMRLLEGKGIHFDA